MEGVLQDLAEVGSGVSLGLVARWAVVARKDFFLKRNRGFRREAGTQKVRQEISCYTGKGEGS